MEDTLRAMNNFSVTGYICLNPCFNGRYSQSLFETLVDRLRKVLILVLMEDTLRERDIRILCISWIGIYKTNSACSCLQNLTAF